MKISELRAIPELQSKLDSHPLYSSVLTLADLRCFMEHHAFPVWDFMSLIKYLQAKIAPAGAPWMPARGPDVTILQRFVNEIVLAEESDEGLPDTDGSPTFVSHFDLYLGAMEEVGADTRPARAFIKTAKRHGIEAALKRDDIPEPARRFMKTTFGFIATDKPHIVAAAFALGREQVIPGMFRALLAEIGIGQKTAPLFHHYLERHIHLDDEVHGPLSLKLVAQLCGDSNKKLRGAGKAARQALEARVALWDGVHAALLSQSKKRSK